MKLNHKQVWSFRYRGIGAEIHHWGVDEKHCPKGRWNYYLFIPQKQIANKELSEKLYPVLEDCDWGAKKYWSYSEVPLIHDLEFHGGVTYCHPEMGHDGSKMIKVGCDYSHYYDEGQQYNQNDLAWDAKNSIDKLHELTKVLIFCQGNGGFYPESEGKYQDEDKGDFYSSEYLASKNKTA